MLFTFNQLAVVQGSLFAAFAALAAPVADPIEGLIEYLTAQQTEEGAENVEEAELGPTEFGLTDAEGLGERTHQGPPHKPPGQAQECKKPKDKNEPNKCPPQND